MCYAVGLTGYSVVKVATPTFYALGDSRTPVALSALTVLANAALNIALVRSFGYRGLALGTALTATLHAVVLMMILRARLGGIDGGAACQRAVASGDRQRGHGGRRMECRARDGGCAAGTWPAIPADSRGRLNCYRDCRAGRGLTAVARDRVQRPRRWRPSPPALENGVGMDFSFCH